MATKLTSDNICPLCCTCLGYDGKSCSHCGMVITGLTSTHFQFSFCIDTKDLKDTKDFFLKPSMLYAPSEILENKIEVPNERGVYGWYFDNIPSNLPQDLKYIKVEGLFLLYVGIGGRDLNKQGNLRKRIKGDHLKGNHKGSTLARTLHAVLGIPKENISERTEWMKKHMKVAWMTHPNPKVAETEILMKYGHVLPLNIEENKKRNPFSEELRTLRGDL